MDTPDQSAAPAPAYQLTVPELVHVNNELADQVGRLHTRVDELARIILQRAQLHVGGDDDLKKFLGEKVVERCVRCNTKIGDVEKCGGTGFETGCITAAELEQRKRAREREA